MANKKKATPKGIVRKKNKNILIIIGDSIYFIPFTAIQNVWKGNTDKNPIFGY